MRERNRIMTIFIVVLLFAAGGQAVYSADKPEDTLKELRNKLENLGIQHGNWYWQTDKNSNEYKEYMAKIEAEKKSLQGQIQALEKSMNESGKGEAGTQSLPPFTPKASLTGPVVQNIGGIQAANDENSSEVGPAPVAGTQVKQLPAFTPVTNKKGPTPATN